MSDQLEGFALKSLAGRHTMDESLHNATMLDTSRSWQIQTLGRWQWTAWEFESHRQGRNFGNAVSDFRENHNQSCGRFLCRNWGRGRINFCERI